MTPQQHHRLLFPPRRFHHQSRQSEKKPNKYLECICDLERDRTFPPSNTTRRGVEGKRTTSKDRVGLGDHLEKKKEKYP